MRALLRGLLIANVKLIAEIPAERWIEGGSVVDTPPRPFAVIRFGGVFRGVPKSLVGTRRAEIWIHDEPGTYTKIDSIIAEIKRTIDGVGPIKDEHSSISEIAWVSDSTDLFDDGYKTITKSTGFDITGSGE